MSQSVVVSYQALDPTLRAIAEGLDGVATVVPFQALAPDDRRAALQTAGATMTQTITREFKLDELPLLAGKLLQLMFAGVDKVPFDSLPHDTIVAHNGGAAAEPMAEHTVAMALAATRRLLERHVRIARGEWDQLTPTRMLRGGACAIFGYGAIGRETAKLMRALGMRIYALNRSGHTDESVEFMGTLDDREAVLRAADVVVLSLALNRRTRHVIGAEELSWMKPDATLINVARGDIVDQGALYAHLQANPAFTACIDAWWIEPLSHGEFRLDHPFFSLPNVIGSPHNSAIVVGFFEHSARHAVANVRRYLTTGQAERVVTDADRL